ncbi:hypothetical protein ACIP9H_23700 [Streptomyces sp. NPDC088732]|uniref:hypothetical protein n=1 Tax=Streptomyces sp. NPDC088732 TaxID=3365879 RepID=UPI0037F84A73
MSGQLVQVLRAMPLFWPGALLSSVAAGVCAPRVARRLGTGPVTAFCLVLALGGIAVTTLLADITTDPNAMRRFGAGTFATDWTPPGPADLAGFNQRSLNVLLFAPLGLAVARTRPARRAVGLAAAAAVLPFVIEAVQYEVVWLMRAADAQDIVDNLCGLLAGLLVGTVTRPLVRRTSRLPAPPDAAADPAASHGEFPSRA